MFGRLYLENEALVAMDAHLGTGRDVLRCLSGAKKKKTNNKQLIIN